MFHGICSQCIALYTIIALCGCFMFCHKCTHVSFTSQNKHKKQNKNRILACILRNVLIKYIKTTSINQNLIIDLILFLKDQCQISLGCVFMFLKDSYSRLLATREENNKTRMKGNPSKKGIYQCVLAMRILSYVHLQFDVAN